MDSSQILTTAVAHHQRGEFGEAERLYRQVLDRSPEDPRALNLLGVLAGQSGRADMAAQFLERAVRADPANAEYHYNLALARDATGAREAAIEGYRQALALRPDYAEALLNLGNLLLDRGEAAEAETCYRKALALAPGNPVIHNSLGTALLTRQAHDAAVACFRQALQLEPSYPEAHNGLGLALAGAGELEAAADSYRRALSLRRDDVEAANNLGMALHALGRSDEAVAELRGALEIRPLSHIAHNSLGSVLADLGEMQDAEAAYRRALELKPDYAQALNNLGGCLKAQGRFTESEAALNRALELRPDNPDTLCNLGNAYLAQAKLTEATTFYRRALDLRPDHADAHLGLATAHLLSGDYADGFQEYEWRLATAQGALQRRDLPQPAWQGGPLDGRRLLVWGEQGIGDQVMFASLLPDLIAAGGRCLVECEARLLPLFARSFPAARFVAQADPPDPCLLADGIDAQVAMGSLPRWLRARESDFPDREGHLRPPPELVESLRARYRAGDDRLVVGISWRAGQTGLGEGRSASLAQWDAILRQPGVRFVNLQYGDCARELADLRDRLGVEVLQDASVDPLADLDACAAQVAAMDLVITVANATAHMAGALGVPVWTLTSHVPQWRWQLERRDSPWYRTMTLFRQPRYGDWDAAIGEVAGALGLCVEDCSRLRRYPVTLGH